jgi:hypothetical protein
VQQFCGVLIYSAKRKLNYLLGVCISVLCGEKGDKKDCPFKR